MMGSRHGSISSSLIGRRIKGDGSLPPHNPSRMVGDAAYHRIGLSSILKPISVIGDELYRVRLFLHYIVLNTARSSVCTTVLAAFDL